MARLLGIGALAFVAVACAEAGESWTSEQQEAELRAEDSGTETIAAPPIQSFTVTPNIVDRDAPTPLTFSVTLGPWNGTAVTCKIPGVGILNPTTNPATTTVTLTLPKTRQFTVACRGQGTATSYATVEVLALPPVVGPEPSRAAVIFYYPWYGSPQTDGGWVHWNDVGASPPLDITSPYYPALGPYSSNDPEALAEHCAWLRRAGTGVLALSWWGIGTFEDLAAVGVLDMAARYRLAVTFHIEPYEGRTADGVVEDIAYLNERYGKHEAFFRDTRTSRHNLDYSPKGVYFLWSPVVDHNGGTEVGPEYWREAVDAIHGAKDSSIVLAHQTDARWIDGGHFDGLYNYGSLEQNAEGTFDWAMALPPGAWYVPSVLPGALFWNDTAPWDPLPRRDGATYAEQWDESLGTGVQPTYVTITSFNEWHEGTQIEPIRPGALHGDGTPYEDFAPLAPDAYLDLTQSEVNGFVSTVWPQVFPGRVRIRTTSDWTVLRIESGAGWLRPETITVSPQVLMARMENGKIYLVQPEANALAGDIAELTIDLAYSGISYASQDPVVFAVERGHWGATTVTLWNSTWGSPYEIANFTWGGIAPDPANTAYFPIPVRWLLP